MNLSYRILWIDDNEDFIDGFPLDNLREHIEGHGFDLHVDRRVLPDEIRQPVDGTQYDLLVVDYNIAEENFHGSDVIRQVRDGNCLTEVIFYSTSGAGPLRQVAANEELEGVFFSGRSAEGLSRKISDVFDLTVRKVIDVDNMRGIVMAAVADLDHLVTDVIRAVHDGLKEPQQGELRKHLLGKLRPVVKHVRALVQDSKHAHFDQVEQLIEAIVALDPADFETLASARSFDSHKRVDMAVSLCKTHEPLAPHKESFTSVKALLLWRNALAHQRPVIGEAGFPVFEPEQGKKEAFDNERTLQLRRDLRSRRHDLQALLTQLKASIVQSR